MTDQAAVSLLRWLRRQLREPTPWRERLEAAVANDDPGRHAGCSPGWTSRTRSAATSPA